MVAERTTDQAPRRRRSATGWDAALVLASAVLTALALARAVPSNGPAPVASASASAPAPGALPKGAPTFEPDTGAPVSGCFFPDHGFGAYGQWRSLDVPDLPANDVRRLAKLLVPPGGGLHADGGFDLLVPSGFAQDFWEWLEASAAEFAPQVVPA